MRPGSAVQERFRIERRITRRSAAARAALWSLGIGGPACMLLVLHARLTGPEPGSALGRLALVWAALAFLAAISCAVAFACRAPRDAALARELDRRYGGFGLFSAAAHVLTADAGTASLGAVVLARADAAVSGVPVIARIRSGPRLRRTLVFLLLSFLIACLPGGPAGKSSGLGAAGAGGAAPGPSPDAEQVASEAPESRIDARIPLEEIIRIELRSDRQIYGLNAEITLILKLESLKPVASDVPLEFMLAVTDGLPSPDVGLGPGFRPVPLRLDWSIPKEQGGKLRQMFPMKETLKTLGIYRPGLFTCEVFARPRDDGGRFSDGVRSNEITFQVAENKEDLQTRMPKPEGQGQQPEKQTDDQKTDDSASKKGSSKPKLGDPDRLPDAQRVASLIQPIVNPGPTTEKEVSVFEREPGGPAPPLPVPRKPADDTPARTFLKRPEAAVKPPDLTAEERDVLRRYFDSIRGQKKL